MRKILVFISSLLIFIVIFYAITYIESLKMRPKTQNTTNAGLDKASVDKLLKTVVARPTLTPQDLTAKEKLISTLKNKDGVILKNDDFSIEYTKSADSFIAEIRNKNVEATKKEIIAFFNEKGFTNEGICSLPLVFYLNSTAAKGYSLNNKTFSPIPDFCK